MAFYIPIPQKYIYFWGSSKAKNLEKHTGLLALPFAFELEFQDQTVDGKGEMFHLDWATFLEIWNI